MGIPRRDLPRPHRRAVSDRGHERPRARDPRALGARRLGRHGPEQAGREGRLGRREAAGLRGPHPRAGCGALRRRTSSAPARDRPEDGRAPGRLRGEDDRGPPALHRAGPRRALRRPPGPLPPRPRALPPRLARHHRPRGQVPLGRDNVRHRPLRPRRDGARSCASSPRGSPRPWSSVPFAAARWPSRCARTTSRPSPGRGRSPSYTNDTETIAEVAVELLRENRPERPVRLLGVRLANFEDEVEQPEPAADEPQTSLAVG